MTKRLKPEHIRISLRKYFNIPAPPEKSHPLDELIRTILSQNTNDKNRDRAFNALKKRYTDWKDVFGLSPGELARIIAPAGLGPTKSRRIHALLARVYGNEKDDLNDLCTMGRQEAYERLISIKGVGPKTASCVLLFSCQIPAFPVDTHIYRVAGRLGLLSKGADRIAAHDILGRFFEPEHYLEVHLNLIRLGREICRPKRPDCNACPLKKDCPSAATGGVCCSG
jgi:endonuclease-3